VQLVANNLTYLLDHIVAGRSIMPGAAMFETSAAAAQTLAESAGQGVCLLGVTIPAPVLLHAAQPQTLECFVDCRTGSIHLIKASSGPALLMAPTRHIATGWTFTPGCKEQVRCSHSASSLQGLKGI
jgi:hypothetical protein